MGTRLAPIACSISSSSAVTKLTRPNEKSKGSMLVRQSPEPTTTAWSLSGDSFMAGFRALAIDKSKTCTLSQMRTWSAPRLQQDLCLASVIAPMKCWLPQGVKRRTSPEHPMIAIDQTVLRYQQPRQSGAFAKSAYKIYAVMILTKYRNYISTRCLRREI